MCAEALGKVKRCISMQKFISIKKENDLES